MAIANAADKSSGVGMAAQAVRDTVPVESREVAGKKGHILDEVMRSLVSHRQEEGQKEAETLPLLHLFVPSLRGFALRWLIELAAPEELHSLCDVHAAIQRFEIVRNAGFSCLGRLYKAAEDFGQDKDVRLRQLPTLADRYIAIDQQPSRLRATMLRRISTMGNAMIPHAHSGVLTLRNTRDLHVTGSQKEFSYC